jgi:hypothetical protein
MALTINQIAASSYPDVVADARKPENQWEENAAMREFERQGFIVKRSFGETIQIPLDYRRNPGSTFLANSLQAVSKSRTEVITAASYDIAQVSVPVVWSKMDEVQTPSVNAKINYTDSLIRNGLSSFDEMFEEALFATSATQGFQSFNTLIPTSGQGTIGGIAAADETWWRNPNDTYLADGSDMEAVFTELWNTAGKGSGSAVTPTLMVADDTTQALFESGQQAQQRYVDTQELKAGFKIIGFKTARFIYSQFAGTKVHFMNPKSLKLLVSKEYFRDKGETRELEDENGFMFKIYGAAQLVTGNKSRLAVAASA